MKKTCFKIVSLALTLVMLLGVVSAINFTTFAAGEGLTPDNPVCVNTYEGLRLALGDPEINYIKLGNTPGILPLTVGSLSTAKGNFALYVVGNKTLTLDGTAKFEGIPENSGLIYLAANATLTIDGNGAIQYWHDQNDGTGAVITLVEPNSTLNVVSDNVTIEGTGHTDDLFDHYENLVTEEQNYSRALYASSGTVNIEAGKFIGVSNVCDSLDDFAFAVILSNSVKANISGGHFFSQKYSYIVCGYYGMYIQNCEPTNIRISGGTFHSGIKTIYMNSPAAIDAYISSGCTMINDATANVVDTSSPDGIWLYEDTLSVYDFKSMYDWGNFTPEWTDPSVNSMGKSYNENATTSFSFDSTELSDEYKEKGFYIKKTYITLLNDTQNVSGDYRNEEGPLSGSLTFTQSGVYRVNCFISLMYKNKQMDRRVRALVFAVRENEKLTVTISNVEPLEIGGNMTRPTNELPEFTFMTYQWYLSDALGHKLSPLSNANVVKPGEYYLLELRFIGLSGYELSTNAACYLNEEEITGTVDSDGVGIFKVLYKTKDYYLDISNIIPPVYGENTTDYVFDYLPTVEDNFSDTFDQASWYFRDENGDLFDGEFENGKLYYLCYELIRDGGGLPLKESISITANGESADLVTLEYSACLTVRKAVYAEDRIYDSGIIFTEDSLFIEEYTATVDPERTEEILGPSLSGCDITYQWYLDGVIVEGETGSSYTFKDGDGDKQVYVIARAGSIWCKSENIRIAYNDTIEATVDTPVVGLTAEEALDSLTFAQGSRISVLSAEWRDVNNDTFEGEFVAGEEYMLVLVIKRNLPSFHRDTRVLINGKEAPLTVHAVDQQVANVSYLYTCEDNSVEEPVLLGDVNLDGVVNSLDAAQILKFDAMLTELSAEALAAADVNGDGVVNSLDAAQILKFDAGLITEF